MPFAPWRAALLPASFGGAEFKVEAGGFGAGRRLVMHEYAHSDVPFTEDLGRKGRRWQMTGYVIGPDYLDARDALIEVCNSQGPFTLVHPSLGSEQAHCQVCNPIETREKGGFCAFELVFFEAGQSPDTATTDTQAATQSAANASNDATAAATDANLAGGSVGPVPAAAGTGGYPNGITPGSGLKVGSNGLVVGGV